MVVLGLGIDLPVPRRSRADAAADTPYFTAWNKAPLTHVTSIKPLAAPGHPGAAGAGASKVGAVQAAEAGTADAGAPDAVVKPGPAGGRT